MSGAIAIVGMACVFPEARNPVELWENVLAQRRAFRRMPSERLRAEDYLSEDRTTPDATYVAEAAVLEGYEFDRVAYKVAGGTYRSADLAHWLALDVAAQALKDAGYADGEGLPREGTGVVLGNTLTGEFSRANVLRLRWPYVRRVLDNALAQHEWAPADRKDFLAEVEATFKAPFPEASEETLAGGLSNTIAGRICNHFDFKAGGYTVDGACASSLLAICNACSGLAAGDLDVALAGGVDLSLDPFELVGFAKTGALAPEMMRIYDVRSAGFWPGEGCGFTVLMRHDDAVASGRRIYGLIRGWGISSDGQGGITRPEADGQLLALKRAYKRARTSADQVAYFEGHGTGTSVGDATELEVLSRARAAADPHARAAAIGSIKANIGHTKAAAGIAGLIKAAMALHSQTIPPTTGCQQPHQAFEAGMLRVTNEAEVWPADQPLRAAISAMGFGGINSHVVLENPSVERRRKLSSKESRLSASAQDAEIFLFAGSSEAELRTQLQHVQSFAARLARSELPDLAAELSRNIQEGSFRAAVVASSPADLHARLQILLDQLGKTLDAFIDPKKGIFVGHATAAPRIGFLFPGQGSPGHLSGGLWRKRFLLVKALYADIPLKSEDDSVATEVAQPAIMRAALAGLRVLEDFGIEAKVAVGHSLGELGALQWAGAFDEQALLRIATVRGRAMGSLQTPSGTMAAIAAPAEAVKDILNGSVSIVGFNSPKQTVIAGENTQVAQVVHRARSRGMRAVNLPVSHAFHTSLVAEAAAPLSKHLVSEAMQPLSKQVFSTVTAKNVVATDDVRLILAKQVTSPVRFVEALQAAAQKGIDLWIEAGPGTVLSDLAHEIVDAPALPIDAGGDSLQPLLAVIGAVFVLGAPVQHARLFSDRVVRPFNLQWRPKFLANPCETAPQGIPATLTPAAAVKRPEMKDDSKKSAFELIRSLVAARAEFPLEAIKAESRLLGDLHLNSISVGQLVAEAARRLGLPPLVEVTDFAKSTVGAVAQALDQLQQRLPDGPKPAVPDLVTGVDGWVRAFAPRLIEQPLRSAARRKSGSSWEVIGATGDTFEKLASRLPGTGVLVSLPSPPQSVFNGDDWARFEREAIRILLQSRDAILQKGPGSTLLLLQNDWPCAGFFRSLSLEHPELAISVINIALDHPSLHSLVEQEAVNAIGFTEVFYDKDGVRWESRLELCPTEAGNIKLGPEDCVLVTGGGKGIGAECAFQLGLETGARLLLLGRADPSQDEELRGNLQRMQVAGIRHEYARVDLGDEGSIKNTLKQQVTAIVHAAGVNTPAPVEQLDAAAISATAAPKIQGLLNVLRVLDLQALKYVVNFGSIIGRGGLQGEAHYALANEWLSALTEQLQKQLPHCRCLSLEWSVWSGVGMGQRLGRLESLRQQGIFPITPEAGTGILKELMASPSTPATVVVTSRYGDLPTLKMNRPELPFLRFLESVKVFYPGVELVVESALSVENDPYVEEHVYHGERLFPAVLGLEAMAQAAMALVGSEEPPSFSNVHFARPVVVPKDGSLKIRVAALARKGGEVEVVLRTETSNFKIDHFKASCRFDARDKAQLELLNLNPAPPAGLAQSVPLDPAKDFYPEFLFHTGRFVRVKNFRVLRAKECLVHLEANGAADWFGRYLPQQKILGDAGVRDAAIHAIQACIPHARLLPVGVKRIVMGKIPCIMEKFQNAPAPPVLLLHAQEVVRQGDLFEYNLELISEEGIVLEKWEGLQLQKVDSIKPVSAWPLGLIAPHVERRLEELFENGHIAVGFGPGSSEEILNEQLCRSGGISRREDGKPEISGAQVSFAHCGDLTLGVRSQNPVGCDLEQVIPRSAVDWLGMLNEDYFKLAETVAREGNEGMDIAATRVWVLKECLKKAGAMQGAAAVFEKSTQDGWLMFRAGNARIATGGVSVAGIANPLVMGVLTSLS